jgi:serine O-acetyltransferase
MSFAMGAEAMIKQDLLRTYRLMNGSKAKKMLQCLLGAGVQAVIVFRFGQWLLRQPLLVRVFLTPWYLLAAHRIRKRWGIVLRRQSIIGEGLYIAHEGLIRIAGDVRIGKNADISHDVTIGLSGKGDRQGCPTIGDNVYIAPGARLFGKITVGNNVKIGANCVVHKDIPDNAIVVLSPGFSIISYEGNVIQH